MPGVYMAALLVSLLGLASIDKRLNLALFDQPKRTLLTLALGVAFFLIWDLNGIALGIFWEGSRTYLVGLDLLPELPIEEPIFLLLLCYVLLVGYLSFQRIPKFRIDESKRK